MRFRYFDPNEQSSVDGEVRSHTEVEELITHVAELRSGARIPAVEFSRHDGSSLVVGVAGERAAVLWTDTSGETAHSISAEPAEAIVFDYFGSYMELPGVYAVSLREAVAAAESYLEGGSPSIALEADPVG